MKSIAAARLTSRPRHARGFTLLEVLVAIVVLSFGVLGVVGLQAAALQANKDARYQSTAVAMARELGDLMRGNKDIAISTSANPYLVDYDSRTGTIPSAAENCFTGACSSPSAVASFNMNDWLTRVQAVLPGVHVVVCFDDSPYAGSSGVPEWTCSNTGGLAVVKLGWTRQSTNRSAAGPDLATLPTVVLPLIAGSVE